MLIANPVIERSSECLAAESAATKSVCQDVAESPGARLTWGREKLLAAVTTTNWIGRMQRGGSAPT